MVPVRTFDVMCKITQRNKIKNDEWGVMGNLPGERGDKCREGFGEPL